MQKTGRIWIGIILLILGLAFLIDQTGLLSSYGVGFGWMVGTFWPLILIVIGLFLVLRKSLTGGFILLVLGFLFQISELTSYSFWALFWPIVIIAIGLSILLGRTRTAKQKISERNNGSAKTDESTIDQQVVFAGKEVTLTSKNFKGGSLQSTFGSLKLDLTKAKLARTGATLEINSTFGSIEVIVPENMPILSDGTPILGGWENKYNTTSTKKGPTLHISGQSVLGSVEIKN
ncbi:LiaF domain-containing protein [Patescibacteria group bacterium]